VKAKIHPNYNQLQVTCATCKTVYSIGTTSEDFSIEICSNCHPFYTGKQGTVIDTESLIKKFQERKAKADSTVVIKKKRGEKQTEYVPGQKLTLKDMMNRIK
jgi:large subunit ribosomal protein L31